MRETRILAALIAGALALAGGEGRAADPIKVGDINSYSTMAAFTTPYRQGAELAIDEINKSGGVLGRPLAAIFRDDAGKPGNAVKIANDLVTSDGVVALTGTFFSHIGLAVSDFARHKKVLFLAAEALSDALTWSKGNKYTFRVRPSTYMQASMMAEEAIKIPAKRWAVVAPNYEFGKSAVETFKSLLSAERPDIEWVAEQWPPVGKLDAGPVVQALRSARPQAIFNATFGPDLARFIREGTTRGFFGDVEVVSIMTGQPEFLDPLGGDAPEGWIVTGYPWYAIETPEHTAFLEAYRARYDDSPRAGSVSGYSTMKTIAAAIRKAGSTETEMLVAAMEGLEVATPFGKISFRTIDHQSTMGFYVGRTAKKDGQGVMVDWRYEEGRDHLPSDDEVRKLRPGSG